MSRIIFKKILPILIMALWMDVAYYACIDNGTLNFMKFWIIAGLPYGIKAMGGILYPVGFDLQGGILILALNVILGAMIGGFALAFRILTIIGEIMNIILFDVLFRKLTVIDESTI